MPKFTVYEVQEEITWRKFYYEVEAEDERSALDAVKDGKSVDPIDDGDYGDPDFGRSGVSCKDYDEAAKNMPL